MSVKSDGILVEPLEHSVEKEYGNIFVSTAAIKETPDLYKGLYVRVLYDGMFSGGVNAEIRNVYSICLYADIKP